MVGDPHSQPNGDVLYQYTNGTFNGNITIPGAYGAYDGTIYVYRGTNVPQKGVTYACSPRCIKMWWAHRLIGNGEISTFFECSITVKDVSNTTTGSQASQTT